MMVVTRIFHVTPRIKVVQISKTVMQMYTNYWFKINRTSLCTFNLNVVKIFVIDIIAQISIQTK